MHWFGVHRKFETSASTYDGSSWGHVTKNTPSRLKLLSFADKDGGTNWTSKVELSYKCENCPKGVSIDPLTGELGVESLDAEKPPNGLNPFEFTVRLYGPKNTSFTTTKIRVHLHVWAYIYLASILKMLFLSGFKRPCPKLPSLKISPFLGMPSEFRDSRSIANASGDWWWRHWECRKILSVGKIRRNFRSRFRQWRIIH